MNVEETKKILRQLNEEIIQTRLAANALTGRIEKLQLGMDKLQLAINEMQRSESDRGVKPANIGPPKELPIPPSK